MTAPIVTRAATAADLPAIVSLLTDANLPLEGLGDALLWVAEPGPGQHPVGVAGLEVHGGIGLLRSLAVLDYRRGAGIGRELATRALSEAEKRKLSAVYVLTDDAQPFFTKLGFNEAEGDPPDQLASSALSDACPDTSTLMVRRLA